MNNTNNSSIIDADDHQAIPAIGVIDDTDDEQSPEALQASSPPPIQQATQSSRKRRREQARNVSDARKRVKREPSKYFRTTRHWHNGFMTEFTKDTYSYLKQSVDMTPACKRPNANYLSQNQPALTPSMRRVLVDWLIELGEEDQYEKETIHLSVSLLDRFLSYGPFLILPTRFQLVGITSVFIAAKYYEVLAPDAATCAYYTQNSCTREEVIRCESSMLQVLDFNIGTTSVYTLLCQLLADHLTDRVFFLAQLLSDLALREYSMLQYTPAMIACACVTVALYSLNLEEWKHSHIFVQLLGCSLQNCVTALFQLYLAFVDFPVGYLDVIYSQARKHSVARVVPFSRNPPVLTFNYEQIPRDCFSRITELADVEFYFAHDEEEGE